MTSDAAAAPVEVSAADLRLSTRVGDEILAGVASLFGLPAPPSSLATGDGGTGRITDCCDGEDAGVVPPPPPLPPPPLSSSSMAGLLEAEEPEENAMSQVCSNVFSHACSILNRLSLALKEEKGEKVVQPRTGATSARGGRVNKFVDRACRSQKLPRTLVSQQNQNGARRIFA